MSKRPTKSPHAPREPRSFQSAGEARPSQPPHEPRSGKPSREPRSGQPARSSQTRSEPRSFQSQDEVRSTQPERPQRPAQPFREQRAGRSQDEQRPPRPSRPPRSTQPAREESVGGYQPQDNPRPEQPYRAPRAPAPVREQRPVQPYRDPNGGYWLCGTHAVLAALSNPHRSVRRMLATVEAALGLAERLDDIRSSRSLPAEEISEKSDIERFLPHGAVHQGIAVLVDPLPSLAIEEIADLGATRERAVVVVLDQVTDPHNVGAVLRSAAAFGALAVVVQDRHAPDETASLAKAASGALERIPLVRVTNIVRALDTLKESGFWSAGLAADGPVTLSDAKLSGRVVLVLGAEGEGLRRLTREHCDHLVRLPMTDAVESLNVSNAAAISLYELARG